MGFARSSPEHGGDSHYLGKKSAGSEAPLQASYPFIVALILNLSAFPRSPN